MKPDFSVGVSQGLLDLAINNSLFPFHGISGGKMDWAVAAVKIKRENIENRNLFGNSMFLSFSVITKIKYTKRSFGFASKSYFQKWLLVVAFFMLLVLLYL